MGPQDRRDELLSLPGVSGVMGPRELCAASQHCRQELPRGGDPSCLSPPPPTNTPRAALSWEGLCLLAVSSPGGGGFSKTFALHQSNRCSLCRKLSGEKKNKPQQQLIISSIIRDVYFKLAYVFGTFALYD